MRNITSGVRPPDSRDRQAAPLGFAGPVLAAAGVAVVYVLATRLGSVFRPPDSPISTLWPPNAVLMAIFLVAPRRLWLAMILALFPVHVLYQIHLGYPAAASIGWFFSNIGEGLLGAACLLRFTTRDSLFGTVRGVALFLVFGVVLAPLVTSFWDAGNVVLTGAGQDYWRAFADRLFSNSVSILIFVPPIVMAVGGGVQALRNASSARRLELALLVAGIVATCLLVDSHPSTVRTIPAEVYGPLPFLIWAAIRFGPWESSGAFLVMALLEIGSSVRGHGPFTLGAATENVSSLRLFLALVSTPLLFFAAGMQERRRAERNLRHSEERMALAFEASRMANWEWDLRTGEVIFTRGMLGFMPGAADGDSPFLLAVVHPDDRARVTREHEDAVRDGSPYRIECRVFGEDGNIHWIEQRAKVVSDRSGCPIRLFGITREVTDRVKASEALAETERIAALALVAGRIAIWTVDLETLQAYSDPGFPSILGIDAPARNSLEFWMSRIYPPDLPLIEEARSFALDPTSPRDERGDTPIPELEYRILHADGSLRWLLTRGTILRGPGGEARRVVGTAIDVTKRKLAELEALEHRRELARLTRVATLGELSGALAHELNQPLTAILSNAQAAKRYLERDPLDLNEIRAILDDIVEGDRRAGEVIRRLRVLLRKGEAELQSVDVNEVVAEILDLMHGDLVTRNVAVTRRLGADLPVVKADRVQLQQVLLNLVLNACDAVSVCVPEERTLTVWTRAEPAGGLHVTVADRGHGVDEDRRDEIFEPFATTKEHGLGLGLTICRSILAAHNGRIWVENNPDRGAAFHFTLPAEPTGS